ncbi:MAG: HAD hydrolase-like protein [Rubrobacteraceae bacterium]|nr:hypothetical protein [Rubrobacteraceae bacterium]MCL6439226.1 HAD hydrolase-like protein [Rubrobacteraceae bacterium]
MVTSGTRKLTASRLRHAGLQVPPALVAEGAVERGKPDPESYLKDAKVLGTAPQRCAVVAGVPVSVQTGKVAGMRGVAVATTHRSEELSNQPQEV